MLFTRKIDFVHVFGARFVAVHSGFDFMISELIKRTCVLHVSIAKESFSAFSLVIIEC